MTLTGEMGLKTKGITLQGIKGKNEREFQPKKGVGRESISQLEGSQASPARPSGSNSKK
jgi:hypothetical protein